MRTMFALLAIMVVVGACQTQPHRTAPGTDAHGAPVEQQSNQGKATATAEPYQRTYRIKVNGEQRGYLERYEELPAHLQAERTYATGTALITDLDFNQVGFVAPNGAVYRLGSGATPGTAYSSRVTQGELLKSLALFYDPTGGAQVTLERLNTPTAPAAPPAKPAAKEPEKAPEEAAPEKGEAEGEKSDQNEPDDNQQ